MWRIAMLNIDFTLLRQQKEWLLKYDTPEAEGLICLLDYLQDIAVASGENTELEVYGDLTL